MLHEYKIAFQITDDQEAALLSLVARANRLLGTFLTPNRLLETLLLSGASQMIDQRIAGMRAALDAAEAEQDGGDAR